MARIADVAREAGVSVATVSRVLNDSPHVRADARERVVRAIEQLSYQPSGIARSMRSQSVKVIGLIISDIQNPFFTALVRAVEDVAYENGYNVLLCNSDESPKKEELYLRVLATERVAGALLVPTSRKFQLPGRAPGIPLVMVDRRVTPDEFDCVMLDNAAGTYQAVTHLIDLGHHRIGLLSLPETVSVGWDRREGYVDALRDRGLPLEPRLICMADFKEEAAYEAALQLLRAGNPPTALIGTNSLLTMGAFRAAQECGLAIPDDLSLIGFDDMPWMRLLQPPLTVISQPTYHIGAEAARLLLRRILEGRQGPPQTIVFSPQLVVRGSTAAPRHAHDSPETA